ncbi:MAG TPA: hypothetical protein VLA16_12500 [Ideonella sp.]|nr:hypothetical protein [Ideonella sp.]
MNNRPQATPHASARQAIARTAGLLGACTIAAPALAAAPPQTAYLEQAQTQASAAQVRSYGVPTTDLNGKIGYWDVTVDLAVGSNGKPAGTATVTSIKRVVVQSNRFVPGNYTDNYGGTCTVNTATLPSGRQETSVSCAKSPYFWHFTVDNGDIAGHPFELQLTAANIGGIPGYRDYSWGIDGSTSGNYGGCFYTNYVVAARQIGPEIVVTRYAYDNIADCGMTLTKVP